MIRHLYGDRYLHSAAQNINYRTENATTKNSVSQNTPRHV
ncbi:hypothetical protein T10_9545 [Trichinella papuae]|uniref:Uncharacterized protein n=1 Tax=Trichinella papuae TaxID=268474 RepID=A0A0V1LYY1_9BILA|nr:hypothetical protein T10_9545 [Trichinella papuae]